jgi:uncharacterized tellurite resistance protein B-like protein
MTLFCASKTLLLLFPELPRRARGWHHFSKMPEDLNNTIMNESETILQGYSTMEKSAYLGVIASLATADRVASQEEVDHITALAQAADLSEDQQEEIIKAAKGVSGTELKRFLDVLQNSKAKYSLIADIITFAKVDNQYGEDEKRNIKQIASYLQVDDNQFSLLDQFVDKAAQHPAPTEEVRTPGFLESLGLKNKFENAGINSGSFVSGLLGMVGPFLLGRMMAGGNRSGGFRSMGRSPIPSGRMGGLGSIFSMLNGGGSYRGMGGMLSRVLR